jgi:hypothetical protein
MAAYVQYWEDIITKLEAETTPQAPTTLQFGFWPSTDWTRTHVPDPPTASEIARDVAEANAIPDDVSPDPWCGPVGRRPRVAFNRYRDVLVGHFVLVRPEDPHIHPVQYGRVIQPPHLNRSSQWYGMFQIRYWRPVRGTRDLSKRERYEYRRCNWCNAPTSYMQALLIATSRTGNGGRSLRQTYKRQGEC